LNHKLKSLHELDEELEKVKQENVELFD